MENAPVSVIKGNELYVHYGGQLPAQLELQWPNDNTSKDIYALLLCNLSWMSEEDKCKISDYIRYEILKIQPLVKKDLGYKHPDLKGGPYDT